MSLDALFPLAAVLSLIRQSRAVRLLEEGEEVGDEFGEAALLVPPVGHAGLVGVLALGEKQSGKYVLEGLDLLPGVAREVA